MDYRWRCADAAGRDVAAPDSAGMPAGFADQGDAEEWLSDNWQSLEAAGVHAVTLLRDGAEVYGPMSLHPAG